MASCSTRNPSEDYAFIWTIENILTIGNEVNSDYFSSKSGDSDWYLQLKIKKVVENGRSSPLDVILFNDGQDFPEKLKKAKFSCDTCILKSNGEFCTGTAFRDQDMVEQFVCLSVNVPGDYIGAEGISNLFGLHNDKLIVKFSMSLSGHAVSSSLNIHVPLSNVDTLLSLAGDLKNIYESGDGSDLTIRVAGKQIRAHKAVLNARAPTFAAIFGIDTKETVEVEEEDSAVFESFLCFLYCGELDSCYDAVELYKLSHKYGVSSLQRACRRALSADAHRATAVSALPGDPFVVVKEAASCGDDDLKAEMINVIFHSLSSRSKDWDDFRVSVPKLASEVLKYANFEELFP